MVPVGPMIPVLCQCWKICWLRQHIQHPTFVSKPVDSLPRSIRNTLFYIELGGRSSGPLVRAYYLRFSVYQVP